MSMNLAFVTKKGKRFVDFPFQTPTNLSYDVLNAKSIEDRMRLIESELIKWKWKESEIHDMMMKVHSLLSDETLNLIVI